MIMILKRFWVKFKIVVNTVISKVENTKIATANMITTKKWLKYGTWK